MAKIKLKDILHMIDVERENNAVIVKFKKHNWSVKDKEELCEGKITKIIDKTNGSYKSHTLYNGIEL